MNLTEWKCPDNFEEISIKALQKKQKTSDRLTEVFNKTIKAVEGSADRRAFAEYCKAYLDYMQTDNEHTRTFLDFIKFHYDSLAYAEPRIEDKEEAKGLMQELTKAFDSYYGFCEVLRANEESFKKALNLYNVAVVTTMSEVEAFLVMNETLRECDKVHLTTHELMLNPLREHAQGLLTDVAEFVLERESEIAIYDLFHPEKDEE